MEKLAMDALDRGWALGFGTRIRIIDPDFEAARAEATRRVAEPPRFQPGLLLLADIGPMPRPAH